MRGRAGVVFGVLTRGQSRSPNSPTLASRRYCEARSFGGASHLEGVYKAFVYRGTQRSLSLLSFVRASQEVRAKDPALSFGALPKFASAVFSCLLLFIYLFIHYTPKGPHERILHREDCIYKARNIVFT